MAFYTPPQRNFDGSPLRRALRAQLQSALDTCPDSQLWAERAGANARRALKVLGDARYDLVMAHYSDAWFEARTWREQASAYGRLARAAEEYGETVALTTLLAAFGQPDIRPV